MTPRLPFPLIPLIPLLRPLVLTCALLLCHGGVAAAANEISAAERTLFMDPALSGLKANTRLSYSFARTGTLDPAFSDEVTLQLAAKPGGSCCSAVVGFLSGERQLKLPELEGVEGNPVLLGFLEHDIAEMERLTGGKKNYFRKRIRMALAEDAQLRALTLRYQGREIAGTEISIRPYADDPMRGRYERLAAKRYLFFTAAAVPGKLLGVRTTVPGATAQAPALAGTELWLRGADPVQP